MPSPGPAPTAPGLAAPFPEPGNLARLAYRELHTAANGSKQQIAALGDPALLPRPWIPATCRHPDLRRQVWEWLEEVVTWLNHEYVWDAEDAVLACWPQHPHLVHEVAVLADQRRRAGAELTSDALEDWHRYALAGFQDRTRTRTRGHCQDGHDTWPAKGRHARHTAGDTRRVREDHYDIDVATTPVIAPGRTSPPHLSVVDLVTGELQEP